jgi:hypothetical protein
MDVSRYFLKWGQKLCPNPLIKKKRIAQLINRKLGKTDTTTPKAPPNKTNQQAHTTYNNHKLTTQRTTHRKENHLNEPANSNGDH